MKCPEHECQPEVTSLFSDQNAPQGLTGDSTQGEVRVSRPEGGRGQGGRTNLRGSALVDSHSVQQCGALLVTWKENQTDGTIAVILDLEVTSGGCPSHASAFS